MKRESADSAGEAVGRHGQVRHRMIDAIAQTMDLYGANYTFGQLYGIMFFEDKPMTLEEMKTHMNMSKSNMSYAVRALTESKMLTKLKEKEERKDLYAVETDFFRAFQNFFAVKLQREIDVMQSAIASVTPELSELILGQETTDEERRLCLKDLHKLQHAESYYEWLQEFVDGLKDGLYFNKARLAAGDAGETSGAGDIPKARNTGDTA